ncbi:hypothetical protein TIFTF001_002970 [Ficus carica]|uniref:Uncharacterized protein n=1 Tax=Ficus carica TaxID=3494 RepID=A0AA88CUI1_FICCA|nr:hypothetical protein TIFTF001_002970 [Ficus carica]
MFQTVKLNNLPPPFVTFATPNLATADRDTPKIDSILDAITTPRLDTASSAAPAAQDHPSLAVAAHELKDLH